MSRKNGRFGLAQMRSGVLLAVILLIAHVSAKSLAFEDAQVALPPGVERTASVEGFNEYRLSNGLRVVLYPDPATAMITVNITYMVGSRHEGYGQKGLAHVLEHLMFKGTPTHTDIPKEMAEHGGMANATTSYDRTNYYEVYPAKIENLRWSLDLESDRMIHSKVSKKDLESEMTVVLNEMESGQDRATGAVVDRTMAAAYNWHSYGRPIIGTRSDIESVTDEQLRAFYRSYYRPDNAILLISGKFDEAEVLRMAHHYFSPIPRPTTPIPEIKTSEPVQDGPRAVTVRRVADLQQVVALYHIPPTSDPDYAPIAVLSRVLGDGTNGRLHKALSETKKASGIFGHSPMYHDPGTSMFAADVRTGDSVDVARDILLETVEGFEAKPVTQDEVDQAKKSLLKIIDLSLSSPERLAIELTEWMAVGDWRLYFLHRDRLRQVTREDVQRVAEKYYIPSNRTVGVLIPDPKPKRAEIKAASDIAAMVKDYKGGKAVPPGEFMEPTVAAIEARTTRTTLPNGMKLALLPKKTRGQKVFMTLMLRMGDAESLKGRLKAGDFAGSLLLRGSKHHTRDQIKQEFDRLQIGVRAFGGGATGVTVQIETYSPNLREVLNLVAEILREPAYPEKEFELARQEHLSGLESAKDDPTTVANQVMARKLDPWPEDDVRYHETIRETIQRLKAVKLQDVQQFHTDFYGASYATMAFVGEFDSKLVTDLVAQLFGSWKSLRPYKRWEGVYRAVEPSHELLQMPDRANAIVLASLNIKLNEGDPDYPAMILANYLLGGPTLNSRLGTRIRQKEGLSYATGSSMSAGRLSDAGGITFGAICAPKNVEKVESLIRDEVARVVTDAQFTAEEVNTAKSAFAQRAQTVRTSDGMISEKLADLMSWNRTLQWEADLEDRMSKAMPGDITAALKRHVIPEKLTLVAAGDFAATKTPPATENKGTFTKE